VAFPARLQRFRSVDSTQRVVREWLDAGAEEVAVAVADYQTEGRGRQGREWMSPPGAGLLLSVGFTPHNLLPRHAWRLAGIVSLAMRDAAEEQAGLKDGTLWLKWPNDIVADAPDRSLLKVAGVLGETVISDDRVTSAVVGMGINTNWASVDFPWAVARTMTSLLELSGKRPIDNEALLDAFLARLEPRYEALKAGMFDAGGWSAVQRTTGRQVLVDVGGETLSGTAVGVDPETGALILETDRGMPIKIDSGDVVRFRVR
jgi:BirA family transcriptional regulator, biotin operon repressor / biotin---[acetyl-CoA-carboxylase] ligase